jgi:hypothetical protein
MRILRVRLGFQADHSSSSYLFYAVDHPVSARGQAIAHRYSSRAEVDDRTSRYLKWGESSLSFEAYKALLGEHYDVMVSESYDWWTLMIALPKTRQMRALLSPFVDARGYDDQGVEVEEYDKRLVAVVYCTFQEDGVGLAGYDDDTLEKLVELLVEIRAELMAGDATFLDAVAAFYGAEKEEEDEDETDEERPDRLPNAALDALSKSELQAQCEARGIAFRKSWTKSQLLEALDATTPKHPDASPKASEPRLTRAARKLVGELSRV